jgi:large conductance mechanosensitive channel
MFKGFKDFLMRGNVIDLAVAVVVGAAFTAIVTAFTTNIIQPLINSIGGTDTAQGLGFTIRSGNPETFVDVGALITAAINFLIVAAVVYFVIVLPYEKLKKLAARHGDDAAAQTESELLTEIRDILQGKDPIEEKAKISAAKSDKDQAIIERHGDDDLSADQQPDTAPPFGNSGPLSRGPLSGTPTQFLSAQHPDAGGPPRHPAPSGPPPGGPPPQQGPGQQGPSQQGPLQQGPPAGGPPPGYSPSGPGYNPPPRPNAPQYGPPNTGPQGPGYGTDPGFRPDPLTGPPPGSYGPPPDRRDGGGRHSQ